MICLFMYSFLVFRVHESDPEFISMKENIDIAIKELGSTIECEIITDPTEIKRYGVFNTPAVVAEKYTVKSTGKVPEKSAVKEWIKAFYE